VFLFWCLSKGLFFLYGFVGVCDCGSCRGVGLNKK
jgi:hypothetical protein